MIFSIAPLLVIVIAIAGFFVSETSVEYQIAGQFQVILGEDSLNLVTDVVEDFQSIEGELIATLVSLIALLFSATRLFYQLDKALNRIWNVEGDSKGFGNLILKRLVSLCFVLVIVLLLLTFLIANSFVTALISRQVLDTNIPVQLINVVISFVVVSFLVALIYKFLPNEDVAWQDVRVGAMVTALLFIVGQLLLSIYLGSGSGTSAYGTAGSITAIFVWIYYSMYTLLIGAEFTQVYAHELGTRRGIGSLSADRESD